MRNIRVGDYKTITLTDGEVVQMQIAGIDTYTGVTDAKLSHHIDFISKGCLKETVRWNTGNNNNGTAEENCPYLISNIKNYLNNTVLNKLPDDLKNVIHSKRMLLETRYSSSGVLTDSNMMVWKNMNGVWIPSEYEILGATVLGTNIWSTGPVVQYPLFANSWKHGRKTSDYWLCTVQSGNSTNSCYITYDGHDGAVGTINKTGTVLCVRILNI